MRIKHDDEFVLTDKAIKREEFLKRISSLKWDNAELIYPVPKNIQIRKNNSENK